MPPSIWTKLFGTKHTRELRRIQPIVDHINCIEKDFTPLTDQQIKDKVVSFKERIAKGEDLDSLLPETFALVREASKRVLGMRHFDVQLIGGIVLHQGTIAEMKTGEGKTLVATLPCVLNALSGKGVHVVTVNDYLAKRDAEWMGRLYNFLGLSTGIIVHGLSDRARKENYAADITYGTNNEYGFDYLRDNMKFGIEQFVQRDFNYAIIDEVDSILIDEARTPLIISGPTEESTDKYYKINAIVPGLQKDLDFTLDEKSRTVSLSDVGLEKLEQRLGVPNLYDPRNMEIVHHVNQALKAHLVFKRDVDYVVKDGQVVIVDEFTGRLMPGRRYSDGLHQALEAKENVKIENENQTLATITFQNYFRMYPKLSGMTGTAETEEEEFMKIYNLQVTVIPPDKPMVRQDHHDLIYKNERGKFDAVVKNIKECHAKGQPVLVGTVSVDKSERLSTLLKREQIPHNVLNAKQHEREAEIIAQAGRKSAITISTNMAGRGTDILLGGNPEFMAKADANPETEAERYQDLLAKYKAQCSAERVEVAGLGGLFILGTERHESRRIDNQLRGRAGRQGDPGNTRFYLSLEDDLMRIFASERVAMIMEKLGMEDDVPIEHPLVNRAIENAQKRVEGHNFDIRKHLLKYDDVMNQQRKSIYGLRKDILRGEGIRDLTRQWMEHAIEDAVLGVINEEQPQDEWDFNSVNASLRDLCNFELEMKPEDTADMSLDELTDQLKQKIIAHYDEKVKDVPLEVVQHLHKIIALQTLDSLWKDHLLGMDHLKEGIGLRGYAQKDPLLEYKKEGFAMFDDMYHTIEENTVKQLFHIRLQEQPPEGEGEAPAPIELPEPPKPQRVTLSRGERPVQEAPKTVQREAPKVGRNDPCFCGSGKKFKKCHGINA